MSGSPKKLRCAVYTRKSTEEGLDQEFNSLDAQHEACVAFITSQVGLGWNLLPSRYDDGGISGGTMDRPALQRLLQDIRDRKVDVVVVYKIDRLTRSLMDFSKIVEIFDAAGASFVSVTQQFNTTTSMGRLTLNVLLSFAQFEREVTAERIRDKIAASRAKGMWMGGRVPFGYRVEERKLVVDEKGAETVRWMFSRFLELRSVATLTREVQLSGKMSVSGQGLLSRGRIGWMLANPLYIGKLRHKGKIHEGEHERIIEVDLFERVQRQLALGSTQRSSSSNNRDTHLLTGIMFDETGERLSPTSTASNGKRYRYYVSSHLVRSGGSEKVGSSDIEEDQKDPALRSRRSSKLGWRIPAELLDKIALDQLRSVLTDKMLLGDWLRQNAKNLGSSTEDVFRRAEALSGQLEQDQTGRLGRRLVCSVFNQIVLSPARITFLIRPEAVMDLVTGVPFEEGAQQAEMALQSRSDEIGESSKEPIHVIDLSITFRRRGQEQRIIIESKLYHPEPDTNLVDMLGGAHFYLKELTSGSVPSIADLAGELGVHRADISRILPLAFLSPTITDAVLSGRQPAHLTSSHLSRMIDIPASWADQAQALGM